MTEFQKLVGDPVDGRIDFIVVVGFAAVAHGSFPCWPRSVPTCGARLRGSRSSGRWRPYGNG